jgi:hypothetical protein
MWLFKYPIMFYVNSHLFIHDLDRHFLVFFNLLDTKFQYSFQSMIQALVKQSVSRINVDYSILEYISTS